MVALTGSNEISCKEDKAKFNTHVACRLFSRGVIFTRPRVSLALLSLRKNGGLLVVYGPGNLFIFFEFVQSVPSFVFVVLFTPSSNVLSRYSYPSLSFVAALAV